MRSRTTSTGSSAPPDRTTPFCNVQGRTQVRPSLLQRIRIPATHNPPPEVNGCTKWRASGRGSVCPRGIQAGAPVLDAAGLHVAEPGQIAAFRAGDALRTRQVGNARLWQFARDRTAFWRGSDRSGPRSRGASPQPASCDNLLLSRHADSPSSTSTCRCTQGFWESRWKICGRGYGSHSASAQARAFVLPRRAIHAEDAS